VEERGSGCPEKKGDAASDLFLLAGEENNKKKNQRKKKGKGRRKASKIIMRKKKGRTPKTEDISLAFRTLENRIEWREASPQRFLERKEGVQETQE